MSAAASIPRYPGDVTTTWLSDVLSASGTPVQVTDVDVTAVGTGQTGATYRVAATYGANPSALPETFIIKLPAQDDSVRDRVVLGYRSECAFYGSVADRLRIPVPQCFHCEITEDASNYALLLADQAPAVQGDQIAGCGEQEARLAVCALAGLHAPTWNQPEWLTFEGLAMSMLDAAGAKGLGDVAVMSADITIEMLGDKVNALDRETLVGAMSLVTPWLSAERGRFGLIHGDYRLDNMLFDLAADRVSVVDWQTLGVGLPGRDLAYFTATSLDSEVRSALERDLVDDYHQSLLAYGVTDYDRDACWDDYRFGMLQAPLITSLGCAFAGATDRGDDMMAVMLRRGCQAIRELGTLERVAAEAIAQNTPQTTA